MESRDLRFPSFDEFRLPRFLVQTIVGLLLALVILWLAISTFFTVEPEEIGVVLRFGAYTRSTEPGLHFKAPWPIETVVKVPVQRQLKQEFGFRTESPGIRTRYSEIDLNRESLMLTGDLNVAIVDWTTQFRIRDPYQYLFRVRDVIGTFRSMNEAVMREVVGDRSVNEVLTVGRQEIAAEVETRLQELCDQYETGIKVEQVVLQDVNPPDPVKPSFNEVNQAQQEREKMINEARAEFNRVIPKARGEAQQTVQQAEGYATDRVNRARGDAELFTALLAAYRKAPEVTRRRMYLETVGEVYPKAKRRIVLDAKAKSVLPLLNLEEAKK
jgi:membrane protease subunit HflK